MVKARSLAHVGKEVLEAMPTLADVYPALAIIGVAFVSWVFTALTHRQPDVILGRMGATVLEIDFLTDIDAQAATAIGVAAAQRVAKHHTFITAATQAIPNRELALRPGSADHCETTVRPTRQVYEAHWFGGSSLCLS